MLLWQQHYRLFHAAEWDFGRFWKEARGQFVRLQLRIQHVSEHVGCTDPLDDLRLD